MLSAQCSVYVQNGSFTFPLHCFEGFNFRKSFRMFGTLNMHTVQYSTQQTGRIKWNDKWIEFWNFQKKLYSITIDVMKFFEVHNSLTSGFGCGNRVSLWDICLSRMKHVSLRSNYYEHLHLVLKSNVHMHFNSLPIHKP